MPRLARSLGMAVGALYRYYPSKDALVAALGVRMLERLGASQRAFVAEGLARLPAGMEEKERALARIVLLAEHYRRFPETDRAAFQVIALLYGDPRKLLGEVEGERLMGAALETLEGVHSAFVAGGEAGLFATSPTFEWSILFWTSLHGVIQAGKFRRFDPTFDTGPLAGRLVETLLRGWGVEKALLRRVQEVLR